MAQSITVETEVSAPLATVWECWTDPKHVTKWNQASPDWHTPSGTNDLKVGGKFVFLMEAKDGSVGFDFGGTYTQMEPQKALAYVMDDNRKVSVTFTDNGDTVHVTETFDAETENSIELQRQGWQAILESFKRYTEAQK